MEFLTPGYESLELSTQIIIKEALSRGYRVDILDQDESFIRIFGKDKIEYIKQATRTSMDSYISSLIMENKAVTKMILKESGINVPEGRIIRKNKPAGLYEEWKTRAAVLKPKSENFGKGVNILIPPYSEKQWNAALSNAFSYQNELIAEQFAEGREFRFLVVDGKVPAVLHRIPANVSGDGKKTIAELIAEKNKNPLRGKGYVTPLEKIEISDIVHEYLAGHGLNTESVPENGSQILLRENSNISTGGDSIDFTDSVNKGYLDIAAASAAAVGVKICGVDIIIRDINTEPDDSNYSVIELNFNPAIHIHNYPWKGKNRHIEKHIFSLLEL